MKVNWHACRLQTEDGESVGPHRVWLGDVWLPGLAMSRAMGDTMARRQAPSSSHPPIPSNLQMLHMVLGPTRSTVMGGTMTRQQAPAWLLLHSSVCQTAAVLQPWDLLRQLSCCEVSVLRDLRACLMT